MFSEQRPRVADAPQSLVSEGEAADTESDQDVAIAFDHLSKDFRAFGATTAALSDITLSVRKGEFVSIIGPSGCGKSTLLRIAADLTPPTAGSARINGKSPSRARQDRDYGIVFQSPTLFDWRPVDKNVSLPLEVMNVPRSARRERVNEVLEVVGLSAFRNHYPWQLSGGMQQRVAIARALVFQPSILLMDEPFGALDEITRDRMNLELMRICSETRPTVLFVTHSVPEAVLLSTRVLVMSPRPGRVVTTLQIDLPQPRNSASRQSSRFFGLLTSARIALEGAMGG
jgi:NitT/TauT family transport system ATP-binding protein